MTDLETVLSTLADKPRLPTLFVGHGSPMNAITDTPYSRVWRQVGAVLPRPKAVLCISAHWMTRGVTKVHVGAHPRTIHDFRGFPDALNRAVYPAPGAPEIAAEALALLPEGAVADTDWGLDHGSWSVLMHLFPKADVPVFQLSLDLTLAPHALLALAARLKPLRDRGVLVLASGNLVHNLAALAPMSGPYPWAESFEAEVVKAIEARDATAVAELAEPSPLMRLAHPTPEHLLPVLFPLAVADEDDDLCFFNEGFDMGSISMRCFLLG